MFQICQNHIYFDLNLVNYWGSTTLIVLTMLYNAVVHCVQYCIWSLLIYIHAGLDIVPFLQSGTAKKCAGMARFVISHSDRRLGAKGSYLTLVSLGAKGSYLPL